MADLRLSIHNKAHIEFIRNLYVDRGMSDAQIVPELFRAFGIATTRNAIIGLRHRAKIRSESRIDPRTSGAVHAKRISDAKRKAKGENFLPVDGMEPFVAPPLSEQPFKWQSRQADPDVPAPRPPPAKPKPLPEMEVPTFKIEAFDDGSRGEGVSLFELNSSNCHWPLDLSLTGLPPFRYCGEKALTGAPYCKEHLKRAHTNHTPRRWRGGFHQFQIENKQEKA